MSRSRLFFKIGGALLVGLCGVLLCLQQSSSFIRFVEKTLKEQLQSNSHCAFEGKVTRISLLGLFLEMEDVRFTPLRLNEGWAWQAHKFTLSLSVLPYFYTGKVALGVLVEKGNAFSEIKNGYPLFLNHVNAMVGGFSAGSFPLTLRDVSLQDIRFEYEDTAHWVKGFLSLNGQVARAGSFMKSRYFLTDGSVMVKDQLFVSGITGTCTTLIDVSQKSPVFRIETDMRIILPQLPEGKRECVFESTHVPGHSSGAIYNHDHSFHAAPLRFYSRKSHIVCEGAITAPLSYFCAMTGMSEVAQKIQGTAHLSLQGNPAQCLSGKVTINNPRYEEHGLDKAEVSFMTEGLSKARGSLSLHKEEGYCSGPLVADFNKKTVQAQMVNHTLWPLRKMSRWVIPAHEGSLSFSLDGQQKTEFSYAVTAKDSKTEVKVCSQGTVLLSAGGLMYAMGKIGDNNYVMRSTVFPTIKPLFVSYSDKQGKKLLHFVTQAPEHTSVKGTLSYDFIRMYLKEYFDYDVPGEGVFHIEGDYRDNDLYGSIRAADTTIRLPETYNFLSGFSADLHLSLSPLKIKITDLSAQLHKGNVHCKEAIVHISKSGYDVTFLYFPLTISECFLNWKEDLFVVGSGSCIFQKRNSKYSLDGYIVIEKGQLKENPLSKKGQKELTQFMVPTTLSAGQDVQLNVSIMTKDPIAIKTPQLLSRAVCDVKVTNTFRKPSVSGYLRLLGGEVHFPYKQLHIMRGEVTFQPQQLYDPIIDLVLQGTLKKYAVTVAVDGSVLDPHITLDSVPALNDEQIVALLFSGTAEENLNVVVPSLLMRNIETVLFGAAKDSAVESWLDPLKRIRIVPSFADQTGRGGFRGALEIDVSDHLHASIQKNFSLSEDTRIEIEYLVSDDIALKAIKDERSDLGGEIEMRFKF